MKARAASFDRRTTETQIALTLTLEGRGRFYSRQRGAVEWILSQVPEERRTALFSATLPPEIAAALERSALRIARQNLLARTEEVLKVIVANPTMIEAYKAGIPGNGQHFPDGSKIVKILWIPKQLAEAPFAVKVPDLS